MTYALLNAKDRPVHVELRERFYPETPVSLSGDGVLAEGHAALTETLALGEERELRFRVEVEEDGRFS